MVNLTELRIEIKKLERHQELYRVLKEELTALGYWRNRARGNPRNAYLHMIEKKKVNYV
jgi:hypothetical protein